MKRGYEFGVAWIAINDNDSSSERLDRHVVVGYTSTLLLADLFEKEPAKVADDICKFRERNPPIFPQEPSSCPT